MATEWHLAGEEVATLLFCLAIALAAVILPWVVTGPPEGVAGDSRGRESGA